MTEPGGWFCPACEEEFPDGGVRHINAGAIAVALCPQCGGRLVRPGGETADHGDKTPGARGWGGELAHAFALPWTAGNRVPWLVGGTVYWVIFLVLRFMATMLAGGGLLALVISIPFYGCMVLWGLETIRRAAAGEAGLPSLADIGSDLGEMFMGALRGLVLIVLTIGPALVYAIYRLRRIIASDGGLIELDGVGPWFWPLIALGLLWLPAFALQLALTDRLGIDALLGAPAVIVRVPGPYLTVVAVIVAGVVVDWVLSLGFAMVPLLGELPAWCLRFYLLATAAWATGRMASRLPRRR